jgi:aminoglycoside phosphotransferase (APT) family kinase protein
MVVVGPPLDRWTHRHPRPDRRPSHVRPRPRLLPQGAAAHALAATWTGAPVWFHGDNACGNLLVDDDGSLAAVIDFGTCGVGDPACDLVIAWTLLDGDSRDVFRSLMPADDAMWARARGWALWKALITIDSPGATPAAAVQAARVAEVVLAEHLLS